MKLVLIAFLALAVAAAVSVTLDRQKLRRSAGALGLDAPGVRSVDCQGPMLRFAVKPEEGIAYVINDVNAPPVSIPLADIDGCEYVDYGERRRGLGRALAGDLVADRIGGQVPLAVLRIRLKDPERDAAEYRLTRTTYREDFRIFAGKVEKLLAEYAEQGRVL